MPSNPLVRQSGTHFYRGGYDPDECVTVLGSTDDFPAFAERFAGYPGWVVIERQDGSRMAASECNLEAIQPSGCAASPEGVRGE